MRNLLAIVVMAALGACQPSQPEIYKATASVPMQALPAFLADFDALLDNRLDVPALVEFSSAIPVDQENQQTVEVRFEQADTSVLYHVWRETVDIAHLYIATPSEALATTLQSTMQRHALPAAD